MCVRAHLPGTLSFHRGHEIPSVLLSDYPISIGVSSLKNLPGQNDHPYKLYELHAFEVFNPRHLFWFSDLFEEETVVIIVSVEGSV